MMESEPAVLTRKKLRLKNFDYSTQGAYFITTCVQERLPVLGKINDEKLFLNKLGKIVKNTWLWLAEQYDYVKLGEFIVMPNHFHGIIYIDKNVVTGRDLSSLKIKSISELIGAFKTVSAKKINKTDKFVGFKWQRSFHDRIIRNEEELLKITDYIKFNPVNWEKDELFNDGQVATCPY